MIKYYEINPIRNNRNQKNALLSKIFDEVWYQEMNPDVAQSSIPGLVHYLSHGFQEGRSPNRLGR
jgi:hypothetical protein